MGVIPFRRSPLVTESKGFVTLHSDAVPDAPWDIAPLVVTPVALLRTQGPRYATLIPRVVVAISSVSFL